MHLEMEGGAQKLVLQNKKVAEKIARQEFSPGSDNATGSVCKASRRSQRKTKRQRSSKE